MKHLRSTPKDRAFFSTYARLGKTIKSSGYFAQVVSALTEVSGIFAAALSVLYPILQSLAIYPAAAVAIIGTAVLEIGLRVTIPQAVDAVLYKRWQGLHLAMSIAVFILGFVLLATSGILSYQNSKTVVDAVVVEPERDSLAIQGAQIDYNANQAKAAEAYRSDSTATAQRYQERLAAEQTAYAGKIGAAKRELSNVYNRERRTGQSFATAKDAARQKIANLEAEEATAIAGIKAEEGEALAALLAEHKAALAEIKTTYQEATASLEGEFQEAKGERAATVDGYGGSLAYFTVICLFIFLSAVILERIHAKGSGIEETVELAQHDISPPALTEAWSALTERLPVNLRQRITAFAEKTPPPPLPPSPAELYDPTALANVEVRLQLEREQEEPVIQVRPKRRQIGFLRADPERDLNSTRKKQDHEAETPPDALPEGADPETLAKLNTGQLKQRLKMYKKRLGRHTQKKLKAERAGDAPSDRTLNAIENNEQWVQLYQHLLNERLK